MIAFKLHIEHPIDPAIVQALCKHLARFPQSRTVIYAGGNVTFTDAAECEQKFGSTGDAIAWLARDVA
jgi:hypothetical protein